MNAPVLKASSNGHYYAHWSEGRRSLRKSMRTNDLDAATKRFAQWLLQRGAPSEQAGLPAYTMANLWSVYWAKRGEKSASAATLDASWANLAPHFGHLRPGEVDQDAIDSYVAKRADGRIGRGAGAATCRKELATLLAALRFCTVKPNALVPAAALENVVLPEASEPRDRWLTVDEIRRLLAAAAAMRRGATLSRSERFLWLALETAARKQAILDLTWDRVDFEIGVIHFDVPGRKQTKKRRASVPISKALRPVLERAFAERENAWVMGHGADMWESVQRVAVAAGFGEAAGGRKPKATGIGPHTLRHTAATHMARRGVPLWKIAKVLGNTLAVVERVYAKWAPDDAAGTVDLISNGHLEPAK